MTTDTGTTIRYHGASTIEVVLPNGRRLLFDPCFTGNEDAVISIKDLPEPDVALFSHPAIYVRDALYLARHTNCDLVVDQALHDYLVSREIDRARLRLAVWGMSYPLVDGVDVRVVYARHSSQIRTSRGELFVGQPVGYVMRTASGFCMYHAGDTALFPDVSMVSEHYGARIGMIPIGGLRGYPAELDPRDAAQLSVWSGLRTVVPIHFVASERERLVGEFRRHLDALAAGVGVLELDIGQKVRV